MNPQQIWEARSLELSAFDSKHHVTDVRPILPGDEPRILDSRIVDEWVRLRQAAEDALIVWLGKPGHPTI